MCPKGKLSLKERYTYILKWFQENKPHVESELDFENGFQLITAVVLSAQCTDKRVNIVTPPLFKKYPTAEAMSKASFEDIFALIRSVTYPNNKAKHLLALAEMLVSKYNSEIPASSGELQKLPGVGRKTANVVASILFNEPVIAVDTHVF